ncbi:hypothetical protein HZA57_03585 [Candidatus Poribacteria bacterium]|nr:hypothetical protein [Candidatus Poribacteria bacterium]
MSRRGANRLPSLRWSIAGQTGIGLLVKVAGLVRWILIARLFGSSAELDAVMLGIGVPLAVLIGVGGGLGRAAVPVAAPLNRARFLGLGRSGARRIARLALPASLLLAATAWLWCRLLVPGKEAPPFGLVAAGASLMSLALCGGAVAGLFTGLGNAKGRHVTVAATQLLYNLVWIGGIVTFQGATGALSIAIGALLAEWSQLLVLWPLSKRLGGSARPKAVTADWASVRALFWPAALMGVAGGLNVAVDRAIATTLPTGSIAALTYADTLMNLLVGQIGVAISVPLYTRLARFRERDDWPEFHNTFLLGIRSLLLVCAPAAVLCACLAEPVLGLLFQRGRFDPEALAMSVTALRGYAAGLPFSALLPLLISAGLAAGRQWSLVLLMAAIVGLNAVLDWYLAGWLGLIGISLSTSVVALVRAVLMLALIAPGVLGNGPLWRTAGRALLFSGAVAALLVPQRLIPGWHDGTGVTIRLAVLASGAAVGGIAAAALWKPLLRAEWLSLERLRGRVAQSARKLAIWEADRTIP